jgi:hypothetical protein
MQRALHVMGIARNGRCTYPRHVADDQRAGAEPAEAALERLVRELDACIDRLTYARDRARRLLAHRRTGGAWLEVVSAEERPLVVESISSVMASLATAGHAWRREQARALNDEDVSINRIAALFGVTRQRISALLRENGSHGEDPPAPVASDA